MKRIIAWLLVIVLCLGLFAGCKKNEPATDNSAELAELQSALEYVKTVYKNPSEKTPKDFQRIGNVPVNGTNYEVVWSANVGEEFIKVVKGEGGMVTIDVNEAVTEEVPYELTATITGKSGASVSYTWKHLIPYINTSDMVGIVKEAYQLANGQSMDYEVTLTGKIIAIGTPYDEGYKNITVTIEIEGAEDMPIVCYRLKGEGAENLAIGDIITVTGTLKNYNGTIEFDAGCTLDEVIVGERVEAPTDPKEIVDAAYKLGANESLPYEATLTGKITKIKDPYSSQYNNISVEIVVEGREKKPILCYRMKGAGVDDLDVGDTVTVKGYIINYVGSSGQSTIEFTAGCQLVSYENTGKEFNMPTSAKEIVKLAYALKEGDALPEEATLTGVIRKVDTPYDKDYKNVTVTIIVEGMADYPIVCFRMKGDGASKIAKGDTITVKGILKNYYGTVEFDAGCQLLKYKKAVQTGPSVSYKPTTVTDPKADTAYKLGVVQKGISGAPVYYFDGTVANQYYLGTSNDGADAIDVKLKATTGGYYLTFGDGKYINVTQETKEGKLYTNAQISKKAVTVWTWDATLNTLVTALKGETYYIGTYNTYTTLSISNIEQITGNNAGKLDVSSFPAHLMTLTQVTGAASMDEAVQQLKLDYPDGYGEDYKLPASIKVRDDVFNITWTVQTENTAAVSIKNGALVFVRQEDEVPYKLIATLKKGNETAKVEWEYAVPRIPADVQVVTKPEAGKAYKLALTQGNLGGSVLFLTGNKAGNFFETTDKSYEAVDVYMEKANGGIRVYFMKDNVKTYVDMYEYATDKVGVEFNTKLTETSAIYKIDTKLNALTATFDLAGTSSTRYLGCYNDFNTMSAATVRSDGTIDGFPAMFVIVNKETPVTLNAAAEEIEEQLPAGPNTATDYTVPASVTLNKVKFDVTWSVTTANKAAVAVKDNTVDVTMLATGAVDYTLKAVIKNAATGESKEFTWNYTVPAKEVSTIKQALEGAEEAFFIVKGVVTMVDGKNVYIQDATGGICLYFDAAPTDIALGDTVVGTGTRTSYNNLPELASASFEKTTGLTLSAKQTTYGALTAADICTYVSIKNLTVTEVYDNNGSYTLPNITVVDAEGKSFQLYKAVVGKTGNAWNVAVGDKLDVTGAVGVDKNGKLQIRTTNADQIAVKALPATLENAVARLQSLYPNGYDTNGNLPTSVTVGETVFNVTWALQTDNAAAVKIEGGKVVMNQQEDEVSFTLTATVSNGTATKQATFTGKVPAKPAVGNDVVIQIVSDGKFVTDEVYVYTSSSTGNSKDELVTSENFADAAVLTVVDNGDGTIRFKTANGKYLYTDGTNVNFADTADENTIFTLEPSANGVYIKSNVIAYEKAQYLEYYSGYVTVYGMSSNTSIYEFKLLDADTPPAAPTAADAATALKGSISTLTNGMNLPTTYTYKSTAFSVVWSVETANAAAAKVEGGKLVLTAQAEDVAYTLKAVVSLDNDNAEASWTGTVAAGAVDTTNYGPLAENTAYNMQMVQATAGKTVYVTGAMDGSYLATTETLTDAAVIYVEKVEGAGVRFYIADGAAKTYIDIHLDGSKVRPCLTATANVVWTFNDTLGVYTAVFEGTEYYLGTYSNFTTINVSKLSYLTVDNKGVSQFFAECVPASAAPEQPGGEPEQPGTNPDQPGGEPTNGLLAEFTFSGDNSNVWVDGSAMNSGASFTDGDYTLTFTDCNKVYSGGQDVNNNGFIKFGTSSVNGTLTFTVPADVNYVVLHLAGYKANASSYTINGGTAVALTKEGANDAGETTAYDEIIVDTSVNKTVTVTANPRMVMYAVQYYSTAVGGEGGEGGEGGTGGETPDTPANTTVSVNIATYATANNWANETQYSTVTMDENVTVTMTGGTNTGKYYTSNTSWRVYQNESPTITVAAEGKTIVSVKITYAVKNSGVLTLDGNNITSGTVVDVNASSVTFSVGNTGTKTNGNIQITAIEVVYGGGTGTGGNTGTGTEQPGNPSTPMVPTLPQEDGAVVSIADAIAAANAAENQVYTTLNYTVIGVVVEVYNTTYGNMRITDDAGNIFTIYGTYSADGNTRYDAMAAKPVAGDTVTIYGPIGRFGTTPQIKDGKLMSFTAATPNNPGGEAITNVTYTYGSASGYSNVIINWGRRGYNATFLSPNAQTFYTDAGVTYEQLAALSGSTSVNSVPSSALYLELKDIMTEAHTNTTTYDETRYLYRFTDCQDQNDTYGISCFYSGNTIGPNWDSGSTWNREHCWPKSKTASESTNASENADLMNLRPVKSNINSSRGNKAYGVSSGYFNPNSSTSTYDVRGDVARIVLYTYVRWGNTAKMWGSEGVIESKDVLLDWMEADPVDTWEMGRNDSVESVTGTRNVFVDYPELAFVLFGEEIPTMVTPSGKAAA